MSASLSRNRDFNIFWVGQGFSSLGDAVALIAVPLLVLQATGSLARMGLVTALAGVGSLVMGVVAGPLVDRYDRRLLMVRCDLGRFLVYGLVPIAWAVLGPSLWIVYAATLVGSALAMLFGVAYITAVANLVDRDQIIEANGRLQATYALAFVLGPMLAGLVAGRFGGAVAIGIDAFTFLVSAVSLRFVRLRPPAPREGGHPAERAGVLGEFLAGVRFLVEEPVFRWLTIVVGALAFLSTGINDLIIYYLRQDLGESDRTVGIVFGIASLGALVSGVLVARMRRRLGFGLLFVGGVALSGLALLAAGRAGSWVGLALVATVFTFSDSTRGVVTMSLRQELTPDHLLGRVTAAFWTVFAVPGPIGAVLLTQLGERIGATTALTLVGAVVLAIAVVAGLSPVRARVPAVRQRESGSREVGES